VEEDNMLDIKDGEAPVERNLLVAFFDLTYYNRYAKTISALETFDLFAEFFEFVGEIVESSGGRVVKFIGDAGLIVFPEETVNAGVLALLDLKARGDAWLSERQVPCRNIVKVHYGPVACGFLGTPSDRRFDVYGTTVNTAAMLNSNGFAASPQVFRKLDPEVRRSLKKHTPPVTYIPVEERHR
jgi:class 3 adenylate cyclase